MLYSNSFLPGIFTLKFYLSRIGSDPLWQAGVPYDSSQSPTPPESWRNGGSGGIRFDSLGNLAAFTGIRSYPAGSSLELRFSQMVTPVKPLNLSKHWGLRYAQLSGAANYSYLASKGATVVNMHQGNPVNPWISMSPEDGVGPGVGPRHLKGIRVFNYFVLSLLSTCKTTRI